MKWQVGELDQRIKFKTKTKVADGYGGQNVSYVDAFECWAKVKPKRGNESVRANQIQAETGFVFVIRNRNDFDETHQIEWLGKLFNIRFIANYGTRAMYLEIDGEAGVAQ